MRFAAAALALCVLAAAGAALSASANENISTACPRDASLGTVRFPRGGKEHLVSLATCSDKVLGKAAATRPATSFRSPSGLVATVETANPRAKNGTATITVDGRAVYRVVEHYASPGPILLAGWSPDSRWLLFAIDPMASASIMADGLQLSALQVSTGRVVPVADMLFYPDYLTWCGSTLVLAAGGDRTATANKRLVAANPPAWKPHALWADPKRAFGSVACAPDGRESRGPLTAGEQRLRLLLHPLATLARLARRLSYASRHPAGRATPTNRRAGRETAVRCSSSASTRAMVS